MSDLEAEITRWRTCSAAYERRALAAEQGVRVLQNTIQELRKYTKELERETERLRALHAQLAGAAEEPHPLECFTSTDPEPAA